MLREIQKLTSLKIMNENFKTISYSIAFLSEIAGNKEVKFFTDQEGNLFKDLASVFTLQLLLDAYDKDAGIEVTENLNSLFPVREFKTNNGLRFIFEQPLKLSIKYQHDEGNKENPDEYVRKLAELIALKSGKKSKIGFVGVNYEIFYPINEPERIIVNNLISQVEKDDTMESGLVKVVYRVDAYTKLNLSVTSATTNEQKGLYLSTNFHSEIRGDNKISDVLERNDIRQLIDEKITKLIRLSDDK